MRKGAVVLAGGVLGVACTVTTINPYGVGPFPGTASQIVGAGGGIVTANDGTTLLIPPGALTADVTVTIGIDPSPAPLRIAQTLTYGHVFGPAGQTFAVPVCVTLAYEPGLLPAGAVPTDVDVYAEHGDAGTYAVLPTLGTDPTHVTGMTTQLAEMVVGYGDVPEVDAGPDGDVCDGSDIEAGEAGL
ncbi:MAG TPA: hypothetical protein VHS09_06225 [Polyangiaceae bacterium]|nr:hypothetical protein [Polyangiaceae bacterium]